MPSVISHFDSLDFAGTSLHFNTFAASLSSIYVSTQAVCDDVL